MTGVSKQRDITCLGFIMDGNRRWATGAGLPTFAGHQRGLEVFKESVCWGAEAGIPHLVYYAFSTENWKRSQAEVSYLMDLFREVLRSFDERVRVRVIGRRDDFAGDIIEQINWLETKSATYEQAMTTVWIALSYGGRAEIVSAVNAAVRQGTEVDEVSFEQLLWTAELPDPDLIVRTGGEQRLSNFLTWKSVYSELLFIDKHWPTLTKDDFDAMIAAYQKRERRVGA